MKQIDDNLSGMVDIEVMRNRLREAESAVWAVIMATGGSVTIDARTLMQARDPSNEFQFHQNPDGSRTITATKGLSDG